MTLIRAEAADETGPSIVGALAATRPGSHRDGTVWSRTQLYRDAAHVIAREHASPLTIEDVAERVFCSRRQLQRVFREIGDTSFRETLTAQRMRTAAVLLMTQADLPVRQVAAVVGYRQPAQFAKAFRRHYGTAPTEYRAAVSSSDAPQDAHLRRERALPGNGRSSA
jgi:AraC family transcriptional regulator, regulatory protein of adaptative response / methylphosphotriester-DNA alkyltransferase methyltransferase